MFMDLLLIFHQFSLITGYPFLPILGTFSVTPDCLELLVLGLCLQLCCYRFLSLAVILQDFPECRFFRALLSTNHAIRNPFLKLML